VLSGDVDRLEATTSTPERTMHMANGAQWQARWWPSWLILAFVLVVAGCPNANPLGRQAVSGSVTLDGAPLDQGSISFQPTSGAATSAGASIAGGQYSIAQEFGLPPGKYRVVISSGTGGGNGLDATGMPGETATPPKDRIPPEWNTNSKHLVEITESGPGEFNFDIQSRK
jgi:hypothetical protein